MSEAEKKPPQKKLTPADVLRGESPLVLTATFEPIVGDRFQPAGFPEIGHVIYKAPRKDGSTENVCIVDSAASMANHLETVCQRSAHDLDLVDELSGMPFIRCVTGDLTDGTLPSDKREVVVTSLTEGHRIASTYLLEGELLNGDATIAAEIEKLGKQIESLKKQEKEAKKSKDADKEKDIKEKIERHTKNYKRRKKDAKFETTLIRQFGIALPGSKKAHPPPDRWWNVFDTIFKFDPNALVHGVLFPKWQIKIPRALTAHLEAFGAGRVDRSGVKFDRLGRTTSGQPIFAVDDATAESIRATFVLDVSLLRSFGRKKKQGNNETQLGLSEKRQELLVALALWKVQKLLEAPFRFRSGCHLRCVALNSCNEEVELDVDIGQAIDSAGFAKPRITDVFWPREELYREGETGNTKGAADNEKLAEIDG